MTEDEVKGWNEIAIDLDDLATDLCLGNAAPINPKDQFDLAKVEFSKALAGVRANRDSVPDAKRLRKLGPRVWELTEFVYGHSSRSSVLRETAQMLFNEAQTNFDEAVNAFRSRPTRERAQVLQHLAAWLIDAAKLIYTRPSPEYARVFNKALDSLVAVREHAKTQKP
jgi:hypothetical protein